MITPELIAYIRREFDQGKTREDIHAELVKGGGWTDVDINEAFRSVIPMQGAVKSSVVEQKQVSLQSSDSFWKFFFFFVILGALVFAIWFFRGPLMNSLNFLPFIGGSTAPTSQEPIAITDPVAVPLVQTKDCGTSQSPDLGNPATYESDAVLACLGNSARSCGNAIGVLENDLFPTIFQISRGQNACIFQLSYKTDSTLSDIRGNSLAGQYISCPLSIVKAIDESNPESLIFKAPSVDNLSRYASQIYFYGIMGVFVENNVDLNRIQALGCRGEYIDSVVASYNNI